MMISSSIAFFTFGDECPRRSSDASIHVDSNLSEDDGLCKENDFERRDILSKMGWIKDCEKKRVEIRVIEVNGG